MTLSFHKKPLLAFALLVSTAMGVAAQSLVERAFLNMPDEYYLTLNQKKRREMLETYHADTSATVQNRFGGQSRITQLDAASNYLCVRNSESGLVQLKVLTVNDSAAYIALAFTACAPVCDAHIGFYGRDWRLLRTSLLPEIGIKDFLDTEKIKADGKTVQFVAEQFDMIFLQYDFNGNDIEVKLHSKDYMEADNYARLKVYLRTESLVFSWKNGKYERN